MAEDFLVLEVPPSSAPGAQITDERFQEAIKRLESRYAHTRRDRINKTQIRFYVHPEDRENVLQDLKDLPLHHQD